MLIDNRNTKTKIMETKNINNMKTELKNALELIKSQLSKEELANYLNPISTWTEDNEEELLSVMREIKIHEDCRDGKPYVTDYGVLTERAKCIFTSKDYSEYEENKVKLNELIRIKTRLSLKN